MIALILIKKIISLFLILFMGVLLVKSKLLKVEESRSISVLTLYLIMPCMILSAFQVDYTDEVRNGLLLAFAASILIHIGLLILAPILKRVFHLDPVELDSVLYSNAGNLIIPLVTAMLGEDWIIYSSAFVSVQLFLFWSHGKMVLCGERSIDFKKILTNVNMIAVFIGMFLFITRLRFPAPIQDSIDMVGGMVGPAAMIVTGMLIGSMNLKGLLAYRRLGLVVVLRLILVPLLTIAFLRFSGITNLVENGHMILLVTLLATMTPSASSVTQMAQVYGRDADYASAINVATTLLCIVTMPVMVLLYQM